MWNDKWQGKLKYSDKICSSSTTSTIKTTRPALGSNSGRRGGMPATNRLRPSQIRDKFYRQEIFLRPQLSFKWFLPQWSLRIHANTHPYLQHGRNSSMNNSTASRPHVVPYLIGIGSPGVKGPIPKDGHSFTYIIYRRQFDPSWLFHFCSSITLRASHV
jgi:hypothetical protein